MPNQRKMNTILTAEKFREMVCDSWHGVSPIRLLCFSAHTNIFECLFIFLLLLVSFGSMNWLPQAVCSTQFLLRVGKHDKCIIHKFHKNQIIYTNFKMFMHIMMNNFIALLHYDFDDKTIYCTRMCTKTKEKTIMHSEFALNECI